jgi:hypothetical protein
MRCAKPLKAWQEWRGSNSQPPVLEIPIGRFVLCRVISLSTAQFSIFAGVSRDGRGRVVSAIRRCAQ